MPKTLAAPAKKDEYFALVRALPLKKIRNEKEHAEALRMSGQLIGRQRALTAGESQYLDALAVLIREFENVHHDPKLARASGIEVLKHLMIEHGMTQRQLSHLLGVGEPAASMILAGARELTKSHIGKLSKHFHVGVGAFFG